MRYIRQEQLDFIPNNFSKIIKNKKLILIGCGGIGSPLAEILVRGGFLNLILIDNDTIEESNLNRQIFFEEDINKSKSKTLHKYLLKINKNAQITSHKIKIEQNNIEDYCKKSDLIIDATDNFKTRKIINKFCIQNKKDWIYNGAIKTEVISCIFFHKNNYFNKIFNPNLIEEKAKDVGILPSTTFLSATIAFNQILKYFLNIKENKLIKINSWNNQIFEINLNNLSSEK